MSEDKMWRATNINFLGKVNQKVFELSQQRNQEVKEFNRINDGLSELAKELNLGADWDSPETLARWKKEAEERRNGYKIKYHQLKKSVKKNDAEGLCELGLVCRDLGEYKEAYSYFEQSYKQGFIWALTNLGSLYCFGKGVEKNIKKAIALWQEAGEQNDAEACYKLSVIYYDWDGIEKDYDKALYWRKKESSLNTIRKLFPPKMFNQRVELTLSNNEKVSGVLKNWFFDTGFDIEEFYSLSPNIDSPLEDALGCWNEYGKPKNESNIQHKVLEMEKHSKLKNWFKKLKGEEETGRLFKKELEEKEVKITLSNKEKVSGLFRRWDIDTGFGIRTVYILIPNIDSPDDDIIGAWDENGEYVSESKIKQDVLKIKKGKTQNDK